MWLIPKCSSENVNVKVYAELAYQTDMQLKADLKLIPF